MSLGGHLLSGDVTAQDLMGNAGATGALAAVRAFVFNPGFSTVTRYRWARRWRFGNPAYKLLSRLAWLSNTRAFGCYLSPHAQIGAGLILPHPVGIVIGDGSVIGDGVTIYQHVTLGRRTEGEEKYPTVEDGVTIYAGATLIGGITIGARAIVGAHAVVVSDVPPGAVAAGAPARITPPAAVS